MSNEEEIYDLFPIILEQRLLYKRRSVNHALAPFARAFVYAITVLSSDQYIHALLDDKISEILKDCEIFFEMTETQAMDALSELSNYATIYCVDMSSPTYNQICRMIKQICVSYPVGF